MTFELKRRYVIPQFMEVYIKCESQDEVESFKSFENFVFEWNQHDSQITFVYEWGDKCKYCDETKTHLHFLTWGEKSITRK